MLTTKKQFFPAFLTVPGQRTINTLRINLYKLLIIIGLQRTGNNREINDLAVITQYLKCITGFQLSRNIGRFGHIMAELPNAFQLGQPP